MAKIALVFLFVFCVFQISSGARIARDTENSNTEIKEENTTKEFVWTEQMEKLYQALKAVVEEQKEMKKQQEEMEKQKEEVKTKIQ